MVALNGFLYGATGAETYAQVSDVGLCVSSSGYWFQQVWPMRPFLRRGNRGEWDYGLVAQSQMIDHGDETWIYYLASDVGNAAGCPYYTGVATIERDRFGYRVLTVNRDYAAAKARRGRITLKPCVLPDRPDLAVNVSHVTDERTVRLALLDDAGAAIAGFDFADCVPVSAPGVRQRVSWRGGDPATLAGRTVRLSAELYAPDCRYADTDSPRLYAIYTAARNDP